MTEVSPARTNHNEDDAFYETDLYDVMREADHLNKFLDNLDHGKLKKYQDARTANPKLGTWQVLEASI